MITPNTNAINPFEAVRIGIITTRDTKSKLMLVSRYLRKINE